MSTVLDLFVTKNPLLAHGPRSHATGIALATDAAETAPTKRRARLADPDAPRIHLGPDHR